MKKHNEKQKKAERHCIHRHDHYRAKLVERWILRMQFWTPDNKIEQVVKADGIGKDTVISYTYDGLGNRISKSVKLTENGNTISEDFTYYIRDVQGNILSTYSKTGASLVLDEQMLYGSDLLGVWKPYVGGGMLQNGYPNFYSRKIGDKQYSIKDHLGNVRVTFADVKIPANGLLQDFVLETQSVSTYYPFGWEIKPLSWAFETFAFGYQGQIKDDELKGKSVMLNYKYRAYDSRVARFFAVDPLAAKYPYNSTYAFSENRVIDGIELEGLERWNPFDLSDDWGKPWAQEWKDILVANLTGALLQLGTGGMGSSILSTYNYIGGIVETFSDQDATFLDKYNSLMTDANLLKQLKNAGEVSWEFLSKGDPKATAQVQYALVQLLVAGMGAKSNVKPVVEINPKNIRFSQSSVNGASEIISSMKEKGWKGLPIDVVLMEDGYLTTIDNTRVLAAHEAGINVKAVIHKYSEQLPPNLVERFTTKKGVPSTWGDAVKLRIGKQKVSYRNNNPSGSKHIEGKLKK